MTARPDRISIRPGAASCTQRPHALHATAHTSVAASPDSRLRHCTTSFSSIGISTNRPSGHASTQSLHAVHLSGSTRGRPNGLMRIASNVQATAQSARPTQPQAQALPPPEVATAAAQLSMPS